MYSSLAASVNTNSPPSEPGRLPKAGVCARDRRHGRRDVGRQLGAGDDVVAVQVGLAGQALQQRPREDRVAARAAVGHHLVGAAGREHLAADAVGVVAQEVAGARAGAAAAHQAQAAVAGVHHEDHVARDQRLRRCSAARSSGSRRRPRSSVAASTGMM